MAGTLVITTLSDGTNSTSATNCIQGSAKAWVNFNGTDGSIRASYNVSSITVNGTGDYSTNFTNAFADTNYSTLVTTGTSATTDANCPQVRTDLCTTSSARVYMKGTNAAFFNVNLFNVAVFR
jgi:hypothetical protein